MTYYDVVEFNDCLMLVKFDDENVKIANVWFSDIISEDKAYEIIQSIKKHLEKVK